MQASLNVWEEKPWYRLIKAAYISITEHLQTLVPST